MANSGRTRVTLACTECGDRNYTTTKNKKLHPERMEAMKYCRDSGVIPCTEKYAECGDRASVRQKSCAGALILCYDMRTYFDKKTGNILKERMAKQVAAIQNDWLPALRAEFKKPY